MKPNYRFRNFCSVIVLIIASIKGTAQDVHNIQFTALPLAVNPAFTGMFDGSLRASAIYDNQWAKSKVPYTTVGGSADFPIFQDKYGNYLAAGIQFLEDKAGDGNLFNANGLFSLAYHKFFGLANFIKRHRGCDLAIGLQGSFGNRQIDLTDLYFGNNHYFGYYPYYYPYSSYLGNSQGYFMVNSGISFVQSTGEKFNYTIGIAANNINQPDDHYKENVYSNIGLNRSMTGTLGINWAFSKRFVLKPSIYYLSRGSLNGFIGGSELQYAIHKNVELRYGSTSIFMGVYQRSGDGASVTAGIESHSFRIGLGYDQNIAGLSDPNHGNGGLDFSIRYVAPAHLFLNRARAIPSGHF